jgi:hypothetical protein
MTMIKLLSAAAIAAAALATPAMAQQSQRHFAAAPEARITSPGVLYIDGRACYPAPRVGAFASQPWTNSNDIPCYPTPDYY